MKTICLYFQVHQPFRLKRYRFFDIGNDHYYYDDYHNRSIMEQVADKCYLPANQLLLDLIKKHKKDFNVTFSISGSAIEQMEMYAPLALESFQKLAKTGNVEFLSETYSHSLSSLKDFDEFSNQIKSHEELIKKYFNKTPQVFRNTELIYSDEIGAKVAEMGFKGMITEGPKHVLGWKSPNYVYQNSINPKLKLLLKNFRLSDDIAFRFSNRNWSEWPLKAEKFLSWIEDFDKKEDVVNLFMDYETFGEHQSAGTGIFEFMREFVTRTIETTDIRFKTPTEIFKNFEPISAIHVPNTISWADEERDLTAWLGNELQDEAFGKLYSILHKIQNCKDEKLQRDWNRLQVSDHFYYMCTKWFSDGDVHKYFNPYNSPYDAFINYMNVLSDFMSRVDDVCPDSPESALGKDEIEAMIKKYQKALRKVKSNKKSA